MAIHEWPAELRPREKLLLKGAASLSDAELLAIFLRVGTQGLSAVDLARHLLTQFGGLRPLLTATQESFCSYKGLGSAKYAQLQAVLEMHRRHMLAKLDRGEKITHPAQTCEVLAAQLRDYPYEVFGCLLLDKRHRVLVFEELFRGTIDSAGVHPREVLRLVMRHNAAAVILAHNHPSGVAEPSRADELITRRIQDVLALVDVSVLDHVIIGDECVSLAERGLI